MCALTASQAVGVLLPQSLRAFWDMFYDPPKLNALEMLWCMFVSRPFACRDSVSKK